MENKEIEDFKKQRWFILHHLNACTVCGKEFGIHENSYYGYLSDGKCAHACEVCSKKIENPQLYTNNHKHPYTIPAPDAKLWRYMDLAKFLSLLESNSLYFTRIDHFQDQFEGAIGTKRNEKEWEEKQKALRRLWINIDYKSKGTTLSDKELDELNEQQFRTFRENFRNFRTKNYISCWHQSDTESEAMWELYTRDSKQGIAIQTTFERLYQSLLAVPHPYFGLVKYINFNEYNNGSSEKSFQIIDAPWYKRESFAHEKEFRVIIEDNRKPGIRDWDKMVPVDLNSLIENIYVSPKAEEWFFDLIKSIIRKRYNLYMNVNQSNLNDTPFF